MAGVARGPVQRVTTLPSSPYNGQEIFFVADATNGIEWHLRYDTNVTGSYKWVFLGGGELYANDASSVTRTSNTFAAPDTGTALSLTLPAVAGVFTLAFGANTYGSGTTSAGATSPAWTGHAAASDLSECTYGGVGGASLSNFRPIRGTITTASDTVTMKYWADPSSTATFRWRWLSIVPVVVG